MIEFHFFGMPIKTLGSLGKIRVGRVTGNTDIFFFCLTNDIVNLEQLAPDVLADLSI